MWGLSFLSRDHSWTPALAGEVSPLHALGSPTTRASVRF